MKTTNTPPAAIASPALADQSQTSLLPTSADEPLGAMEDSIRALWDLRLETMAKVKSTRETVAENIRQLEEELTLFKATLVKLGRAGKWSPFLRKLGMSKTTADRYVVRCKARNQAKCNEASNLVSDEISERTLRALAKRYTRSLRKKLTNVDQTRAFIQLCQRNSKCPQRNPL